MAQVSNKHTYCIYIQSAEMLATTQEAIILTMVVAPMGLSCVCSYNDNHSSDKSTLLVTQFPLPYIIFDLFALIFRVSTTGFYLKEQYFQYCKLYVLCDYTRCVDNSLLCAFLYTDSESKRNVYVLETSAVLIIVLLWFLSFPFVVSFYTPLFRRRASDASPAPERLNYTAKQYPLITFLITVEGWKENTAKDEESSSATAAAAVPMAQWRWSVCPEHTIYASA